MLNQALSEKTKMKRKHLKVSISNPRKTKFIIPSRKYRISEQRLETLKRNFNNEFKFRWKNECNKSSWMTFWSIMVIYFVLRLLLFVNTSREIFDLWSDIIIFVVALTVAFYLKGETYYNKKKIKEEQYLRSRT